MLRLPPSIPAHIVALLAVAAVARADLATDDWPRKIRDLSSKTPATIAVSGFRITLLDRAQTPSADGTGGAPREVIVQNIRTASKRVFTTQTMAVAVLESFGGWPQFEVWTRPTTGSWWRSLFRLTPRGYENVRTDAFTDSESKATDKYRTARIPGEEGEVVYYVETRLPKCA